jgi:hypothetical protein
VLKAYCFLISITHKHILVVIYPKENDAYSNGFNLSFSRRELVGALMIIAVIFGVWAW